MTLKPGETILTSSASVQAIATSAGVSSDALSTVTSVVQAANTSIQTAQDVTTIAQAVALALGRALYGDDFKPDKEFPRADVLPEPVAHVRQQRLAFSQGAKVQVTPTPVVGVHPGVPEKLGNGEGTGNGDRLAHLEFIGICPDCGAHLVHENGCAHCQSCGYSRC